MLPVSTVVMWDLWHTNLRKRTQSCQYIVVATCTHIDELGLLGCCALCLGNFFPTLRRMYCLRFWGYELVHGLVTLKMKAVRSFETSRRNSPTTWLNNPCYLLPQPSCCGKFTVLAMFKNIFISDFLFHLFFMKE